jgi:hypothetical protein
MCTQQRRNTSIGWHSIVQSPKPRGLGVVAHNNNDQNSKVHPQEVWKSKTKKHINPSYDQIRALKTWLSG